MTIMRKSPNPLIHMALSVWRFAWALARKLARTSPPANLCAEGTHSIRSQKGTPGGEESRPDLHTDEPLEKNSKIRPGFWSCPFVMPISPYA